MFIRSAALSMFAVTLLAVSSISAAPREAQRTERRAQAASSSSDSQARATLQRAVNRHINRAGIRAELRPLTVSPALVQLRRYMEKSPSETRLVCIVDLAIADERGRIVATVRGNASSVGTAQTDVIDAAARSAVERLPSALQALRQSPKATEIAQR